MSKYDRLERKEVAVRGPQTELDSLDETISGFPALIEVTLEELETGLESGLFTSVDLVNVRFPHLKIV